MFGTITKPYKCKARPWPGGPIVEIEWYFAAPDAKDYPFQHVWLPRCNLTQIENDESNPDNVGELTPAGWKGPGFRNAPTKALVLKSYHRKWTRQTYPPAGKDGQEWHGTPAQFLGEPEDDGRYSGRAWSPGEITDEEFNALPECIRTYWMNALTFHAPSELILESRLETHFADVGFTSEIILESVMTLASEEPTLPGECDLLLWSDGEFLEWTDDAFIEIYCPGVGDLLLWSDGEFLEWDDEGFIPIT